MTLETKLWSLVRNHRWTWHAPTAQLLASLPGADESVHPAATVAALDSEAWRSLEESADFMAQLDHEYAGLEEVLAAGATTPSIAYVSAEFGISELVPQYSGGLGILAGDHLKSASDLNLPLVGVGLFYAQGFFHQELRGNEQAERYEPCDPILTGHVDTGVEVSVQAGAEVVHARVWSLAVGNITLYVLDTNLSTNSAAGRAITDRLYSGDTEHRIRQELVLGIGGIRALRALGVDPAVVHLNEGHAGFLLLELLQDALGAGATMAEAKAAARSRTVFTTHTPVPAGIDRFKRPLVARYLKPWATANNVDMKTLYALGESADDTGSPKPFNMAALCLRLSGAANGVSKLHGEVSRELFANVPGGTEIGSITNGVHARTWVAPHLADIFDRSLGDGWDLGAPDAWAQVETIGADEIRGSKHAGRTRLINVITDAGIDASKLSADALTVGFARRFATYKRADLILQQMEQLEAMLEDDDRPVQFVFAGKAHPADIPGKALLHKIVEFSRSRVANGRFIFIPDYEMGIARAMYDGCDVWLNNPIRPREASGTSGEKAALNGGLQCSILDGWWAEMYDGENGWAIPMSDSTDPAVRDRFEGAEMSRLFDEEIIPLFYAESDAWIAMVRHNWSSLGPQVTAARMVADYRDGVYAPAAARAAALA